MANIRLASQVGLSVHKLSPKPSAACPQGQSCSFDMSLQPRLPLSNTLMTLSIMQALNQLCLFLSTAIFLLVERLVLVQVQKNQIPLTAADDEGEGIVPMTWITVWAFGVGALQAPTYLRLHLKSGEGLSRMIDIFYAISEAFAAQ